MHTYIHNTYLRELEVRSIKRLPHWFSEVNQWRHLLEKLQRNSPVYVGSQSMINRCRDVTQAPFKKVPLPPPKKVQSQVPCPNTDATISADCQHSLCYELHPASRRFLGVVQLKTSVYFQRGFLVFVPLTSVETLYFTCEERCGKCLNWQKR